MPPDIADQRFGHLVALVRTGRRQSSGCTWYCQCDCTGRFVEVSIGKLRSGHTRSCGCYQRRRASEASRKHGATGTHPLWSVWSNMRNRCRNPRSRDYGRYGGRGISIDPAWDDFERFVCDVGARPRPDYELHRVNNDGGYEPGNCAWIQRDEHRALTALLRLDADGVDRVVRQWRAAQ